MEKIEIDETVTMERIKEIVESKLPSNYTVNQLKTKTLKVTKGGPINIFILLKDKQCIIRGGYVPYMIPILILISLVGIPLAIITEFYILVALGLVITGIMNSTIFKGQETYINNVLKRELMVK